jgi:hypothetical protein
MGDTAELEDGIACGDADAQPWLYGPGLHIIGHVDACPARAHEDGEQRGAK